MSDGFAEFHQAELRWTGEGQQGFSIVARSDGFDSGVWQGRLLPIARPPDIEQSVTTVYKVFGDDAALIFRFLNRPAGGDRPDDAENTLMPNLQHTRKGLITRALTGPVEFLTPEIALTSSYIGCPVFLYPPPGQVAEKASLPLLKPETLRAELKTISLRLDLLAQKDLGLGLVISEALREPMRPLTLQLPAHEVASRSAIALLWGLWRTTGPILTSLPGWHWSFSTGEEPLGQTDPNPLPHLIVHRLRELDDPLPTFERPERLTRPHTADASMGTSREAPAAQLLSVAYRSLRSEDYSGRVANLPKYGATLTPRLAALPQQFREFYDPAPPADPETSVPDHVPPQPETQGREVPPATHRREQPAPLSDDIFPLDPVSPPPFQGVLATGESFSDLFSQLAVGDGGSALALEKLRRRHELNQEPNEKERAHLRALMTRERWFVEQLAAVHEYDITDSIGLLLDIAVEPDIAEQNRRGELIREIWRWTRSEQTPAVVILALDDISTKAGDYELQQALINGIGHRWRRDHGKYQLLRPPAEAQPFPGHGTRRTSRLLFFRDQQVPAGWANAIVGICVIEIIVFAILLALRG